MANVDKLGPYIQQLMATAIESEDDFVKELSLSELSRLKVNIEEFLHKHVQQDEVADKPEKQLLQEDKNVKDK
tara:strand:+ start:119 stop:337 length:219 start_codon:yes stop_codon:yes gene_type:complete